MRPLAPRARAAGKRAAVALAAIAALGGPAPAQEAAAAPRPATPTATAAPEGESPSARAAREIARLRSPDPAERAAAEQALRGLGRAALPAIRDAIDAARASADRLRALEIEIDPHARARPHERWYETKLREAAQRIERGDHLGAWKLLDAMLVVDPDCPIRDRIQALKVRSRELFVRATVVSARIVAKKLLLAPGEPIEADLEVKNVSERPIDLAFDGSQGEIFGALEIETFCAAPNGDRIRLRSIQPIKMSVAARLAPGESWRARLVLDRDLSAAREPFRRVTLSGSLRPAVLSRLGEPFNGALPLFPVDVIFVDPAYQPLAADPAGAIREALDKLRGEAPAPAARDGLERRVFFAALIGATTAREATIETLAGALAKENDPAGPAAIRALAAASDNPPDRAVLLDWLRRR